MRIPFALAALFLAIIVAGCQSNDPPPAPPPPDPYPEAFEAGRRDANAGIAQGRPKWLRLVDYPEASQKHTYLAAFSGIDEATMIPWMALDSQDPSALGRVTGNNDTLREYIDQYGLPDSSRARWQRDILNLRGCWESSTTPPTPLIMDGAPAYTPDKSHILAWRKAEGPERSRLVLVYVDNGDKLALGPLPATAHPGAVEVLFGPEKSDLVWFHWRAPDAPAGLREGYSVLDLRDALWLRHEYVATP